MYQKELPKTIQCMFDSIAKRYDRTNAILSFYLHKKWNRALVHHTLKPTNQPHVLLDLCCGTGDIAFAYLNQTTSPCHAHLIDFSSEMLEEAKRKAEKQDLSSQHQVSYIEANVEKIPLPENFVDCTTIAYGIRNVENPGNCIQDVYRVLKPGGSFGILELTRPQNPLLRFGHYIYLKTVLPIIGKWITKNPEAYQYLCQSIHAFAPQEIEALLKQNGFINTKTYSLTGGIATIMIGYKPCQN